MFQKGYGLGDLFRNIIRPVLKPVLRETKGIAKDVGMDLAENLLNDLIAGKTSKASVKARGKEVKGLAGQRAVQAILRGHRGGNGNQLPSGSNLSNNTVKRERSQSPKRKQTRSKSKPPKRKRAWSKSQPAKRKRTQTGGVQPPLIIPLEIIQDVSGPKLGVTSLQFGGLIPGLVEGESKEGNANNSKNVNPENKREDVELERNVNP